MLWSQKLSCSNIDPEYGSRHYDGTGNNPLAKLWTAFYSELYTNKWSEKLVRVARKFKFSEIFTCFSVHDLICMLMDDNANKVGSYDFSYWSGT